MDIVEPEHHYEVRCPRCKVSFAPETRTCVYCGDALRRTQARKELGDLFETEAERPSLPFRATVTLLWVLLGVAITLYRACAGPS